MGSAGGSAAPLTLHPCPGLLQAPAPHPALLWHRGELQVLPLSRGAGSPGRLKHRDQSSVGPVQCGSSPMDPLVPRAGALVRHSSLLSSVRTKARTIKAGGKSLPCLERSNRWVQPGSVEHREGPRRLLSTGLTPRSVPLHVAISTSAGPGAVPWLAAALVPLSRSRALGSGALPPILGTGPSVPHGSALAVVARTRLWF